MSEHPSDESTPERAAAADGAAAAGSSAAGSSAGSSAAGSSAAGSAAAGPSAGSSAAASSSAARGAWMASGLTFFIVGVVFTITMPDNIALGVTFLGLGVVFYSLAGTVGRADSGVAASDAADEPNSATDGTDAPPR